MRLRNAAVTYSALTFARSAGTLVLRIVLVIGYGLRHHRLVPRRPRVDADPVAAPVAMDPAARRRVFSTDELRQVLRFGLPRLPHGLAQQALEARQRSCCSAARERWMQLGVYQNGSTLGTGVRFFTSAFETAWAPFYYATSRQPDAKQTFGKMTTYGVAVLVLLVAGTTAVARDVDPGDAQARLSGGRCPSCRPLPSAWRSRACIC